MLGGDCMAGDCEVLNALLEDDAYRDPKPLIARWPPPVGGWTSGVINAQNIYAYCWSGGTYERPELVTEVATEFGSQCAVVAIDAKRIRRDGSSGFEVFVNGGRTPTGIDAVAWARHVVDLGGGELLVTSMDRDGTEVGYDLALTRAITEAVDVPVIASGGAGTLDHLVEAIIEGGADAVLAASMFHFEQYTVAEAKRHLTEAGIPVRPAP